MEKGKYLNGIRLLAIFIGLTMVCSAGGLIFYNYQKKITLAEKHNELIAISQLKVDQIENWQNERLGDAKTIFLNQIAIKSIQQWITGNSSGEKLTEIYDWLTSVQESYHYSSVLLMDKNLNIISGSKPIEPLKETGTKVAHEAIDKKTIIFSDIHSTNSFGPHLDLAIPLFSSPKDSTGLIGLIYFRIDAAKFLFPLIQNWPTASNTSETLLIRREGNNILYLNELRHRKNTALNLQFPLTDTTLPAVKAANGITGLVTGRDYRGVKVVANIAKVNGTSWFLITKVDADEIYQPIRYQATWIFSFTFLLIFVGALITYFLWRRYHLKMEIERLALIQHFEYLIKYANDVIILTDLNGNIIQINEKAKSIYGYSIEELLTLNLKNLRSSESKDQLQNIFDLLQHHEGMIYEAFHCRKNGELFPVEISSRMIEIEGTKYYQAIIRDITERKMAGEQLRETTEYLENLFNYANAPIIVWDSHYRITRFNHALEKLTGKSAEAVIGQKLDLLFPHDSKDDSMEFIRKTTAGEKWEVVEIPILNADGSVKIVLWNSANVLDKDHKTIHATIAQGQDITERKQAEAEIIKNRRFLSDLIENSGNIIYAKDTEGRYTLVNRKWEEVTRLSRISAIGKTDKDLFPGQMGQQFYFDDQQVLEVGSLIEKEEVLIDESGTRFYLSLKFPLFDENNQTNGICVISTDITARKMAEQENTSLNKNLEKTINERTAELLDLYNNAPCGYHSLNNNGIFEMINDTELKWLGYNRDEIVGKVNIAELLTDESKNTFNTNFPVFKRQGWIGDLEFEMIRKDGSILPVILTATAIRNKDGNYLRSRSTLIDHTERKKSGELQNNLLKKLEISNKELEAFAYSVSHDLRAPLRGIDGWSLALLEDFGDTLDETAQKYLSRVRSETQRMGQLIDDMLKLSRVTRSEMKSERVALSQLVENISQRLKEANPERNLQFAIQPERFAVGDTQLLEIALTNLLDNAVKYTKTREVANIEFGTLIRENELNYYIRDNGVGFDMNHAKKLFGAFQRMHNNQEFPGTGIGLATVQRIIHRHAGEIRAESKVDEGTTFYFTLGAK